MSCLFVEHNKPKPKNKNRRSNAHTQTTVSYLEHGFHNVSRWMTWLPISLKNAAKCDKWYQLQNHSITESLNANGAREKSFLTIPVHAVSLSVEQKPKFKQESWLVEKAIFRRPSGYPEVNASNRRFMGNSTKTLSAVASLLATVEKNKTSEKKEASRSLCGNLLCLSFVTDLSAAGSPAELKHITQRRKRKQP